MLETIPTDNDTNLEHSCLKLVSTPDISKHTILAVDAIQRMEPSKTPKQRQQHAITGTKMRKKQQHRQTTRMPNRGSMQRSNNTNTKVTNRKPDIANVISSTTVTQTKTSRVRWKTTTTKRQQLLGKQRFVIKGDAMIEQTRIRG